MNLQARKGSKWFSIVHLKCPRCQEGNLFSHSSAYHFSKMLDMPRQCSVCKQDFVIEPGFYSGALWVSYPIVLLLIVPSALFILFGLHLSLLWALLIPFIFILALQPLIMRYSRAIWINMAVSYAAERETKK